MSCEFPPSVLCALHVYELVLWACELKLVERKIGRSAHLFFELVVSASFGLGVSARSFHSSFQRSMQRKGGNGQTPSTPVRFGLFKDINPVLAQTKSAMTRDSRRVPDFSFSAEKASTKSSSCCFCRGVCCTIGQSTVCDSSDNAASASRNGCRRCSLCRLAAHK